MQNHFFVSAFFGTLLLTVLSSCSPPERSAQAARSEAGVREFSQRDKVAARALSIGNEVAIENANSPYAKALLCRNAIGMVRAKLLDSGSLSKNLLQGFNVAQAIYDRKVDSLGTQAGKSETQVKSDLRMTAASNLDDGTNARVAMACIRELEKSASKTRES